MNLRQLNRLLLQTLLVPVFALLFVAAVLAVQIRHAQLIVAHMQSTTDNIANAEKISALTVDEETAVRGYQLTGNEIFLQPYQFAQPRIDASVRDLRANLLREGTDPKLLDAFTESHKTWLVAFAEPIIQDTANGLDTRDTGLNLRAKAQMDHVRATLNNIIVTETLERTHNIQSWRAQVRRTLQILVGLALVIGLAIGISARNRLHRVSKAFQDTLDALRRNAQLTYDSEQRLRTTLTSIAEGVIVCDLNGRVELLNAVAQHLTGWSAAEALHQPIESILHLVDEVSHEPIPITLIPPPNDQPHLVTAILINKNGTEIPIEKSSALILDRADKPAGLVKVFRDISEQRRSQAALVASEKLAVSGRLAATLAHEIHNPLDAVVNLLYLLKSDPTPKESVQFLDLASKELDRVTHISRAMLGMYRESITPVAVDVRDMLENLLLLIAPQFKQQHLEVHLDFAPNVFVQGYPAELRQVFLNLLNNAAEASPADSTITIHTELLPERRRFSRSHSPNPFDPEPTTAGVLISIADTGPGIPETTLAQLFQPFFTTKGEQGTGLGLWVSKGIVEKHGGTISIKSNTNPTTHGTTVTVFLPSAETPNP